MASSNFYTMTVIMSGIMLLFYFTGLSPTNPLLNLILSPESMTATTFWITLMATIAISVGGVVFGMVFKNLEIAAMSVIIPLFVNILWSFVDVYIIIASYNKAIALLIFAPLLLMFAATIVDYWRGRL